ncbi:hypothetical protein GUJ93_ZPchr0004g39075 [Zizania palustris]|uniref:Uncharacterized protein n=1 Tax=Zizania palustris TaxID=103762 RepID=A0A8J5SJD2_ZIZPA|nr:hypothetical protein GUJ93_ZPchr0004g39075 [Zizania palustris]
MFEHISSSAQSSIGIGTGILEEDPSKAPLPIRERPKMEEEAPVVVVDVSRSNDGAHSAEALEGAPGTWRLLLKATSDRF